MERLISQFEGLDVVIKNENIEQDLLTVDFLVDGCKFEYMTRGNVQAWWNVQTKQFTYPQEIAEYVELNS